MRRPHELDYDAIQRLFPPPPEYFETTFFEDPDTIARKQLLRLQDRAHRAWQVPFFPQALGGGWLSSRPTPHSG